MKFFYKLFFSKQNLLATIFLITLILYFISSFDLEKTMKIGLRDFNLKFTLKRKNKNIKKTKNT